MRQALIVLALLALVLVGCGKKQEVDQLVITDFRNPLNAIVAVLDSTERRPTPDPCPPCPDTVYQMPPGYWLETNLLCYWYLAYFEDSLALQKHGCLPDSVFVLSPGEE